MATAQKVPSASTLNELVDEFQASGRYTFVRDKAMIALHSNGPNLKKAAWRLECFERYIEHHGLRISRAEPDANPAARQ